MDNTSHYLEKRNVTLGDRRTTIQLETYFWHHLDMIIEQEQLSLIFYVMNIMKGDATIQWHNLWGYSL